MGDRFFPSIHVPYAAVVCNSLIMCFGVSLVSLVLSSSTSTLFVFSCCCSAIHTSSSTRYQMLSNTHVIITIIQLPSHTRYVLQSSMGGGSRTSVPVFVY